MTLDLELNHGFWNFSESEISNLRLPDSIPGKAAFYQARIPILGRESQIRNHQSQPTHASQITNHQSRITSHQSHLFLQSQIVACHFRWDRKAEDAEKGRGDVSQRAAGGER